LPKNHELTPDCLKPLDAILSADPRQEQRVVFIRSEPGYRKKTLEDHYTLVSDINIKDHVPDDVKVCFETARNLLLYSWFVYRFTAVAEFEAYASLECALRIRARSAGDTTRQLKALFNLAVRRGWLSDAALKEIARTSTEPDPDAPSIPPTKGTDQSRERVSVLAGFIPDLRNVHAHGSQSLGPGSHRTLRLCAALINHLFE